MKYLPLYKKFMRTGRLPDDGLCFTLGMSSDIYLFNPTINECRQMFWGYNGNKTDYGNFKRFNDVWRAFTPLRQNVVLLLAAMNNEL